MKKYRIAINSMATGKLVQGDSRWGQFNDSFVNHTISTTEVLSAIYLGHAYACWHEGRRKTENFSCGQHVGIDMDTKDERSTLDTLKQHELLRTYGGIIHTTPSHTPDEPRARVILFLDQPIQSATAYAALATFLMTQFAGHDESCKDASRFFYGAHKCDIWYEEGCIPLAHLRHFYRLYGKSQPAAYTQPIRDSKVIQMSSYREKKFWNQGDDFDRVQAALRTVNPWDMDYSRWIGVLAMLKREFGDAAFAFAEEWADGKPGEVQREWNRIKTERGGKQMTKASAFYMAKAI